MLYSARHGARLVRPSPFIMDSYLVRRQLPLILALFTSLPGLGCASTARERAAVVEVSSGQTVAGTGSQPLEVAGREPEDEAEEGHGGIMGKLLGPKEHDGDGIADDEDQCPDEPEDRDGFQDMDGCPEFDNDADGIADASDKCPNEPETVNGFQDEDGCPDAAIDRAKRAYREGATAFAQGDYANARKFFEEAFHADPRDQLLFNMAVAADKQGDRNAACRYYRQWLGTPDGASSPHRNSSLASCP